jgi:hypothetical protein
MTRTWTSDTDTQKPGETTDEQKLRAWFERLPRMRAEMGLCGLLICRRQSVS